MNFKLYTAILYNLGFSIRFLLPSNKTVDNSVFFLLVNKRSCVTKFIKIQTVKSTTKLGET